MRPAVFYLRNRTLILILSLPIAVFSLARILENLRCGEPWLNWLAGLLVWLILFFLALRRRLVIAENQLEYTESFSTLRVPWSQVAGLASRKALGIWRVEGLEVWSATPTLRQHFVDLTQFDRNWRQRDLGKALRAKTPHLFEEPTS